MKKISFDIKKGYFLLDNILMAPLNESEFIKNAKENKIEIDLAELGLKNFTGSILTSKKLQDYNSFDKPNAIEPKEFKGFKNSKGKLEITIPAFSVIALEGK